jgi:hypothetical protein
VAPCSFGGCHAGQQVGARAWERGTEQLYPRAADQQRHTGSVRRKAAQSTCGGHANSPEVDPLLQRCGTCLQDLCRRYVMHGRTTCLKMPVLWRQHQCAGYPAPGPCPQVPGSTRQTGAQAHPRMHKAAGLRAGRPPRCLQALPCHRRLRHTKQDLVSAGQHLAHKR